MKKLLIALLSVFILNGCSTITLLTNYTVEGDSPTAIMSVTGDSFFSLMVDTYDNLYAGTYCGNTSSHPEIYKYGGPTVEIAADESIFSMYPLSSTSMLVSTESEGYLFTFDTTTYTATKVMTLAGNSKSNGAYEIGEALGSIWVVGGNQLYRYGVGVALEFGTNYFVKDVFGFNGKMYVIGYSRSSNCAGWFVSSDGSTFTWVNVVAGARFMSAAVSPDGDDVVIVGTSNYSGGSFHDNSAAIYHMDEDGISFLKSFSGDYIQAVTYVNDAQVVFGTTTGWKSSETGAAVYSMKDYDDFDLLYTTGEAEIWDIVLGDDCIYIATRTHKVGGYVYKME